MAESEINISNVENCLEDWLLGVQKVVIAGVGNPIRKDDFVGIEIVRNLKDIPSERVYLIECETVPESFIKPIIEFKPSHILILDAALLNLQPGSSKLIKPHQMVERISISTHALPLKLFCEYLAKTTEAKIALLLVQPKDTSFGEGLTAEVKETADNLANFLSRILS